MKLLLVNPAFPPSLWDFAGCRDLDGKRYAYPPLALATLAGLTPREHEVTIADENLGPVDLDAGADVVGITGLFLQRPRALELARELRRRGRRVALGGPLVEASTAAALAPHADFVFQGEAERTWPRFLDDLARGEARALYVERELVDLREAPPPRFDLLELDAYATATLETSRGCPYTCEFCEIPARLGSRSRTKTAGQVLSEVRALHALGADSIFLVDDHFAGDREHARAVLRELSRFSSETGFAVRFTLQLSVNLTRDEELLELLPAANVRRVFVGLETPRREGLASVGKRQNLAVDVLEALRRLQERNVTVWAGMIVGLDTDDAAVFDEHVAFLRAAAVPVVMTGLLQAIPGTPLHARLQAEGRLEDAPMSGVRGTHDAMLASNVVPKHLSQEELVQGYQALIRRLYDEEEFGARLVASLERARRPLPRRARAPGLGALATIARVLRHYLLGTARRRRLLLRVVSAALRRPPRDLETALVHLVLYKHLREFHEKVASLGRPAEAAAAPGHDFSADACPG